jgi:endonuclease YncB( thermonuclease family)
MKFGCRSATVLHVWLVATVLVLVGPAGTSFARAPWVTLENCRYLAKRFNDGDSFHISVSGKEYIFRLYFVDAPETSSEFRDRVEEQAKYFGITPEQTTKAGEVAKAFTREKLSGPFLVRTCWENAMGRSRMQRFYAFVQTNNGDLGEQLVENGLARIHGASAKPEGLASVRPEWQKLARLEKKAKREKIGAWGANEDRMTVRTDEPQSGPDPFEKFFHPGKRPRENDVPAPERANSPAPSAVVATPTPPTLRPDSAPVEAKLDINNASQTELEDIPGIGPALAKRIMAARPFKSADDLKNVKGFGGPKKYEKVRPYFK